ncbi:membrane-spanning 4-domains subfamily A member 15-like [Centropristis striata]|uniref:membrane-spanning 4-domains subfamily A member 15-like n=1 Tax=Centropristis striata TaxID=184440 RepID=UPI0027E20A54|nr:membrane-spanning 4-domains subfamily A member 15-like [Centropristis striata]
MDRSSHWDMSASGTPSVVLVTRVQRRVLRVFPPPPPPRGTTAPPEDNYTFNRATPLVVGMVQIIFAVGILVLCVMVFTSGSDRLAVSSGVVLWGPVTFIIAGSLTVFAGASLKETLIKSAVRFNMVAVVAALAATVLFFVDVAIGMKNHNDPFVHHRNLKDQGLQYTGFSFPMSFLEFGLSLQVVLSRCRGCEPQAYTITNQVYGSDAVAMETPPPHQAPPTAYAPPPPYEKLPDHAL